MGPKPERRVGLSPLSLTTERTTLWCILHSLNSHVLYVVIIRIIWCQMLGYLVHISYLSTAGLLEYIAHVETVHCS